MSGYVPRWLRVHRDYPRATSHRGAWCRADGEAHASPKWLNRSAAHRNHAASLQRLGAYDTRWTLAW